MPSLFSGLVRGAVAGTAGYFQGRQQAEDAARQRKAQEIALLLQQHAIAQQDAAAKRADVQDAFGRNLQASNFRLGAQDRGYVAQPPNAVASVDAAANALPIAAIGLRSLTDAARAGGTVQAPNADGSTTALSYNPLADQPLQERIDARRAASANADRAEQVRLFLAQQADARAKAALDATNSRADAALSETSRHNRASEATAADRAAHTGQITVGPDGTLIDLRTAKAGAQLANQYNKTQPVLNADKFATNAANTLKAVELARAGDRNAHFGALYGYIQEHHPGLAVRKGDKQLIADTQGLPADIQMKINQWTGAGGLLTPRALDEIEQGTHELVGLQRNAVAPVQAQYGALARTMGADSATVARDPLASLAGQGSSNNVTPPAPKGSSTGDINLKAGDLADLRAKWDRAAAALTARRKPLDVLGPRP